MTEGPSVAVSLADPSAIRQIVTTSVAVAVAVEMMIQVTLVAVAVAYPVDPVATLGERPVIATPTLHETER
jgi:hypothetical protein